MLERSVNLVGQVANRQIGQGILLAFDLEQAESDTGIGVRRNILIGLMAV